MLAALKRALNTEESRSSTRLTVRLPVKLGASEIPVTIVNISNDGAKIASDIAPTPGQPVDILWADKIVHATVRWTKSRYFGVTFEPRLSNNQLTAMVSDGLDF